MSDRLFCIRATATESRRKHAPVRERLVGNPAVECQCGNGVKSEYNKETRRLLSVPCSSKLCLPTPSNFKWLQLVAALSRPRVRVPSSPPLFSKSYRT